MVVLRRSVLAAVQNSMFYPWSPSGGLGAFFKKLSLLRVLPWLAAVGGRQVGRIRP